MLQQQVLTQDQLKVFESIPDLYLLLSPELHILTASESYLKATFAIRQNIVGKHVFDVFPENPAAPETNSVKNLHDSLQQVLTHRQPHKMALQRYDIPRPAALGGGFEEKYWHPVNTPVLDDRGNVLYIIHKVSDATQEVHSLHQIQELTATNKEIGEANKVLQLNQLQLQQLNQQLETGISLRTQELQQAQAETEQQRAQLEAIFMQAPVAIGIFVGEHHIVELANPTLTKILGRPAEELLGKPLFDALPEVRGQGFEAILADVYTTGQPFEAAEIPAIINRAGSLHRGYYHLVYQPLRNAAQQITGVIQISIDISEQVATRQRIELKERQLRLITDALPVLIGYLDKEEKYRFTNKAYESWFPVKSEELLGQHVRQFMGDKGYQGVKKYIDQALAGQQVSFDARMPYRDSFIKHIHTNYIPDIQQGEVQGFYTLVTDVTEQAEAWQRLAESNEKYQSLFTSMDQGFCLLEMIFDQDNKPLDYRFLEVNPTFEQQTGLHKPVGKTARELVPNLENQWFEIYGKVALTGESTRFIEGSEAMNRWFEVFAYRLGGSESRKVALLFSNITERRNTERAIKESEERFRTIANASPIALWMSDEQGNITYINQTWLTWTGKPIEAHLGQGWLEAVLLEDRARVQNKFLEDFSARRYFEVDFRIRNAAGEIRWCVDNGQPYYDTNGNFAGYAGSCADITDRKWTEEALKESENHFRTFANNIQNLAWMAEPDGWIYWYNQRWYDYTGTTFEEMRGWGWKKTHHPDHIERVLTYLQNAWSKGETWELTFPLKGADGQYRWFLTRAIAVKDTTGTVVRWIGTNTNIDDQKQAEASLAEKNKELIRINNDLDNFIYTASHDLRAPILNIEGLVNVLNKTLDSASIDREKIEGLLGMIYTSTKKFKETIKDLTEVAKVQPDGEEDLTEVSFKETLEDVKLDIQTLLEESDALVLDDFSQAPELRFSKKNLRSILYNLLSNALKYRSPERPAVVQITTSRPDSSSILLCVQDNGLGMRAKDVHKVFKMFTRLHMHVEGTGIGMSIVKKIVDNNGGKVEIESELGKGSLFKLYLNT